MSIEGVKQLPDIYQDTPLHIASTIGDRDIIDILVKHGALLDAENIDGNTPLHLACREGHMDCVKLLLELGAKESKGWNENSLLHYASESGRKDLIDFFLRKEYDVNAENLLNETPLHLACIGYEPERIQAVQNLLEHQASLTTE